MAILNLKVEDRGRLIKRKKAYALNRCRTFVPACIVSSFTATVKKNSALGGTPKNSFKRGEKLFFN